MVYSAIAHQESQKNWSLRGKSRKSLKNGGRFDQFDKAIKSPLLYQSQSQSQERFYFPQPQLRILKSSFVALCEGSHETKSWNKKGKLARLISYRALAEFSTSVNQRGVKEEKESGRA